MIEVDIFTNDIRVIKKIQKTFIINRVYTENNKLLKCSNGDVIYKLINNDNVKIYTEINKYKLPNIDSIDSWLDNLYKEKNSQIQNILDTYNIKI